jgi:hypothetical protein
MAGRVFDLDGEYKDFIKVDERSAALYFEL